MTTSTYPSQKYMPILLTKRGELAAVNDLPMEVKHQLTPMFVVHPIDIDFETDAPSRSVVEHVFGLGKKIANAWGTERAFLDTAFVIDESDPIGGLCIMADEAAASSLQFVPVVSPGRPEAYVAAVAGLHQRDHGGVCIRLSPRQWPYTPQAASELASLVNDLAVAIEEIDLVLDLADEVQTEFVGTIARFALANLPHAERWRSVVLAGAAFPRDLGGLPKNAITRIPRSDWRLYSEVASEAATTGQRVPTYGDYAVAHPDPTLTVNPRFLNISASLRYTSDDHWLVAKGAELFKGRGGGAGGEAIRPAAQMLVQDEKFCGPDFSEGDRWIDRIARDQTASCGNPERWRRTATNHHLLFITDRLATPSSA